MVTGQQPIGLELNPRLLQFSLFTTINSMCYLWLTQAQDFYLNVSCAVTISDNYFPQ